jgi:CheY-like chemotaxis protein
LHQVLLNHCINARDAMPQGGQLSLTVSQRQWKPTDGSGVEGLGAGSYVVVEVADTGTGIAPEIRDRVFEPFFTTKPSGKGTGLGLSIARNLVREHQGAMEMESKPGEGTRFRVWLPQSTVEVALVTEARPATELVPMGRRCVLVVDDEESLRELMTLALEQAGYRVLSAGDGAEGVSVFGRHQDEVEVVVVDMMMPYLDGAAAIEAMRRIKPGIPVVAISGLPEKAEAASQAAPSRAVFLQKPFSVRHLTDQVGRMLAVGEAGEGA